MKWTQIVILSESEAGVALGYTEGDGVIDPAGIILPSRSGLESHTDGMQNAQIIARSVNSYEVLVKSLTDAARCLDEAVDLGASVDSKQSKRWAAAASQARFALDRAKETAAWYAES